MKILVAAEGNTLESQVSKRFERSGWFLFIDTEVHTLEALQPRTPRDQHTMLSRAAQLRVSAVIAGRINFGNLRLLSSLNVHVAYAHNMSARQALEKLDNGELQALVVPKQTRNLPRGKNQKTAGFRQRFAAGTPRGQHHLQQYAGRGH
jgi:predicted Fe-Mo cluster-binding NifX family protein